MTKQEFIEKIKPCKACHTKRTIRCSFDVTDDFKIELSIECIRCGQKISGDNQVHVLANWNAQNHDNTKGYLVTSQAKTKPYDAWQIIMKVESISEIALKFQENHPEYEILSIKELPDDESDARCNK